MNTSTHTVSDAAPAVSSRKAFAPEGLLVDRFGRAVRSLRVSVTDRCNLRCVYCMPAAGITWYERSEILTFEEIVRVVRPLRRAVSARSG
jgi:cyclic pyranopterin phosphate synthase